jgi:hypothetical protein
MGVLGRSSRAATLHRFQFSHVFQHIESGLFRPVILEMVGWVCWIVRSTDVYWTALTSVVSADRVHIVTTYSHITGI